MVSRAVLSSQEADSYWNLRCCLGRGGWLRHLSPLSFTLVAVLITFSGFAADGVSGVSAGTVTRLPIITGMGGILLEPGGGTVLINEGVAISRFDLNSGSVQTVVSNLDRQIGPGLVMEMGGASVLTFAHGCNPVCSMELVRVNLATGEITSIAGGLTRPQALVLEPGEASVLVTQGDTGLLSRINLLTEVVTTVASGLGAGDAFPHGIALEPNGETALVASMEGGGWGPRNGVLYRVDLNTGAVSIVSRVGIWMTDVVLEAGGTTAIAVVQGGCCQSDFVRIDLASGVATHIYSTGDPGIGSNWLSGLALESSGTTALTVAGGTSFLTSALLRVNLGAVQSSQILTYAVAPKWVTVEPNGSKALLSAGAGLFRADLETGRVELITQANASAEQIAIEATGTTGILAYKDYFGRGGVLRVDSVTNAVSVVAAFGRGLTPGPSSPEGIALEPLGLTALVADVRGTLWRVNLADGLASAIASGFSRLVGVAISATGQEAYVTGVIGTGTDGVYRVDLSTGQVTPVARDITVFRDPRGIVIEAGGTTALFTAVISSSNVGQYGLFRLDLLTGQITLIASLPTATAAQGIALERGGATALVADGNHFLRVALGTPDTDGDGMPDAWEIAHGLNPNDPSDAALDPDGDGLTNLQEFQAGTDPHNPDTDGDGFTDGEEITASTDPLVGTEHPPVAVILVHGINSNSGAFSFDGRLYRADRTPCRDYFSDEDGYGDERNYQQPPADPQCLPWMGLLLDDAGFLVAQPFDYRDRTGIGAVSTIEQLAGDLAVHIECVLRGECIYPRGAPVAKVDIVAHSMGGLITRAYLSDMGLVAYMGKVRRVIMTGTPNYGSIIANLCPDFLNVQCKQMEFGSNFIWGLHENWRNRVLPEERILPEHLLVIVGTQHDGIFQSDDDGVVNVASAAMPLEFLPGNQIRYVPYRHADSSLIQPVGGPTLVGVGDQSHCTFEFVHDFLGSGQVAATCNNYTPPNWILQDGFFLVRLVDQRTRRPVSPDSDNPIDLTGIRETNAAAGIITVVNLQQTSSGYPFTVYPQDGLGYIVPPKDSFNTGVITGGRSTIYYPPITLDPGADLIISSLSGPAEALPGRRAVASIVGTVKNPGTVKAGSLAVPWSVALVLSPDPAITADDTLLLSNAVDPLSAGQEVSISYRLVFTPPSTPGCYFFGGIADSSNAVAESSEENNTNSSPLRVAEPLKIANDRHNRPPKGKVGVPYIFGLAHIGGISPWMWTLDAGELPPGLALTPDGVIFGTPTTRGTFRFTVRVTDGPEGGPCPRKTDPQRFTITIR